MLVGNGVKPATNQRYPKQKYKTEYRYGRDKDNAQAMCKEILC